MPFFYVSPGIVVGDHAGARGVAAGILPALSAGRRASSTR
jgi:hypothetical protein